MDIDDLDPIKKAGRSFAQEDLSTFSVGELQERIEALKAEIARCEALIDSKQGTRAAADGLFKI